MAPRDPLYLHKETRLNLEPSSPALIVDLKLSTSSANGRGIKRASGAEEDDKLFRQRNCATASSVYHRKHHAEPKSFLWRVLDGNTLLSIRCIDVCKTKKAPDAKLILNLRFSQPIRPSCVALSDPRDHDVLSVFVIDHSNQLYTIALKPEYFRKRSTTEISDACKAQSIQALGFKAPHSLVAAEDNLLVVTTHDGGIIRLDRSRNHDGMYIRNYSIPCLA
jgi:nuclear pore complex protein Nup160